MKLKKLLKIFFITSALFCFLGPIDIFAEDNPSNGKKPPTKKNEDKTQQQQQQQDSNASTLFEEAKYENFEEQPDSEPFNRDRLEP